MKKMYSRCAMLLAFALTFSANLFSQCSLNCGTGADGAYVASSNTTLAGGTYNYSSFTINSGVTVTVTGSQPLVILCAGNVAIDGTLDLSGANGGNGITSSTYGTGGTAVAGGQNGGDGSYSSTTGPLPGIGGNGTGAGGAGGSWSGGGGAGYAAVGQNASSTDGIGGNIYGNTQISSAIGGSGGGGGSGGYSCGSGGGGGGGGYVSISACGTITISATGSILSNGGNGGSDGTGNCGGGGGGSGGSIILQTNSSFTNNGIVSAVQGTGGSSTVGGPPYYGTGADGSVGRIRCDYGTISGAGTFSPAIGYTITPFAVTTTGQTNVLCNGGNTGSATVTATGGTGPYTYAWAPSGGNAATATGLTAGTYTCTVVDNTGCTITQTITITEPSQLQSAAVQSAGTSCAGSCDGMAVSTIFGGTPNYTYLWTPGGQTTSMATNLCAGTYTFTGTDANGCVTTSTVVITSPPPIAATVMQLNNVTCNGACNGAATVVATGGTGPYSYFWTPSGCNGSSCTNLCAGTYTVTVTDANACTTTVTFTITEPTALLAASTSTPASCFGACDGSLTGTAGGGTPMYTYLWMPSGNTTALVNGVCSGTYTFTVTDGNGCTATSTTTVTQPTQVVATSTHTNPTSQSSNDGSATATATGGTGAYVYSWAPSGGNAASATGLGAGTYTCTVTDSNGCSDTTVVTLVAPNGIPSIADPSFAVNLFPNPSNDHLSVSITMEQKANVTMEVYNIVGEKVDGVDFGNVNNVNQTYNTSKLANGVYFFRISSGTLTTTRRITVSH